MDNKANTTQIFVYEMNGTLVGSWTLDGAIADPQGITIRPSGGDELWIVDRHDARVYYYAQGRTLASGTHPFTSSFALKPGGPGQGGNREPYGIADPNQPPDAVDDQSMTAEGVPVDIYVLNNDTDPDQDPLTVVDITAPPMSGTAVIDPTGQFITYTPYPGFAGDSFQYQVSDGNGGFDVATVNVLWDPPNEPPYAEDDYEYEISGPRDIYVLMNDYDPESDPLEVINVTLPSFGTAQISPTGDYVTYTPTASPAQDDSFQYTVSDGQGNTATAMVWIYAYVNQPPYAEDDFEYDVAGPTNVYVLMNDYDPDGSFLEVTNVTLPSYGTAEVSADGQYVIYTPGATLADDTFQYTITDSQGATATATVSIFAYVNQPPYAEDDFEYEVSGVKIGRAHV